MNVSPLQVGTAPQVAWTTVKAQNEDADFLSLRLLNKNTRIRLSPGHLDLGDYVGMVNYLAIANSKGWFVAISKSTQGEYALVFSTLEDLRNAIANSKVEGEENFAPSRVLPIAGHPVILVFAFNERRLVVGFEEGPIVVYDTNDLFTSGGGPVEPLRVFPASPPGLLQQIVPNPGEMQKLVAVRREAEGGGDGLAVEILDLEELRSLGGWKVGSSPDTIPTAIQWSPKGMHLGIGLRSGDIVSFEPRDPFSKKIHLPKPPSVGTSSVISISWLTSQMVYVIYAPPGKRDPHSKHTHFIITFETSKGNANAIELASPYFPSPALRPPDAYFAVFRNWEPAKFLLFIGDGTSSDIGLVGSLAEAGATAETWSNLTLEDTSTPSVPLNKMFDDTALLAMGLDLTNTDETGKPARPILYIYADDGTVQSWYVSNERGGLYKGMVTADGQAAIPQAEQPMDSEKMDEKLSAPPALSAFSQAIPAVPAFGTSGFGNGAQGFGQPAVAPAFSIAESGPFAFQKPAGFAQAATAPSTSAAPAFGQTSLGQASRPATGFGAFANQAFASFGSAPAMPTQLTQAPPVAAHEAAASPEAEMTDADEGTSGGFGSMSLGEASGIKPVGVAPVNSMFGSFAQAKPTEDVQPTVSTSGFGSFSGASAIRPGIAFGAVVEGAFTKSQEGAPAPAASAPTGTAAEAQKPSSAFGTMGFAAKPQTSLSQPSFGKPAFGQPAFGQPAFGQSAFGQPAFGQPAFGQPAFGQSTLGQQALSPPSQAPSSTEASAERPAASSFVSFSRGPAQGGFGSFATTGRSFSGDAAKSTTPLNGTAPTNLYSGTPASSLIKPGTGAFGSFTKQSETATTSAAPSMAEAAKPPSAFGPGSTTPTATTSTSAFSAFSGGDVSGFSAYASATKTTSFSELLKAHKDAGQAAPVKSAFAPVKKEEPVIEEVKSEEEDKEKTDKAEVSETLTTPSAGEGSYIDVSNLEELDQENLPPTPSTHGTFDEEEQDLAEEEGEAEEHEDDEQFLSDNFSSEEDHEEHVSSEEEDAFAEKAAPVPQTPARAAVQSPSTTPTGEPSTTPKATPPSKVEDVPSTPARQQSKSPSTTPESTTPKATPPALKKPETLPATPAKPSVSAAESFTPVGPPPSAMFGRPPARPVKSSPLAGAPISADEKPSIASQPPTTTPEFKARPASPKPAFGHIPPATTTATQEAQKTSLFSPQPSMSKATPPTFPGPGAAAKPPHLGAFSIAPAASPSSFTFPSSSIPSVSAALPSGDAPFVMPKAPQPAMGGAPPTKPSAFGMVPPRGPAIGVSAASQAVAPQQAQRSSTPSQEEFESAMQRECMNMVTNTNDELEQLKRLNQAAGKLREILLRTTSRTTHTKDDFKSKEKWGVFGDLEAFCKVVKSLDEDIAEVYEANKELMPLMREVESNLLKVQTRKEEIVRFSKAKADPEFEKMLKARTLGPDAVETQNQLRKQIRLTTDRVEQLEVHLAECKKKIAEHRRGRLSITPPSLDTVNRTYRNIDLAIGYHSRQISELSSRVAKLDLDALDPSDSASISWIERSSKSRDISSTRSDVNGTDLRESFRSQVTPSIAASTAAALNAERVALRLKKALAEVRKAPLVNTQVVGSLTNVSTLEKLSHKTKKPQSSASAASDVPLGPVRLTGMLNISSDFDVTGSSEGSRRNLRSPSHAKSARLGKSNVPIPESITSFDWGPLPGAKPMSKLPSDIGAETLGK